MNYQEFIRWLEDVPLYGHKDGIRNIQKLMERMGDPQKQTKFVHIAGTNGKGSVCAMTASVLKESGLKVGMYTSPHLVTYTERIRVDGENIPEEDFLRIGLEVKAEIDKMVEEGENHCTFFEILTAIGFLYFAEEKTDIVLLEVGVGGRLDATNIIEEPLACGIVSISLDHTKVLGDTVEKIAAEKAGIMKKGCPVVLSENAGSVQQVVTEAAAAVEAPYVYAPEGLEEALKVFGVCEEELKIPLVGYYQKQNKCTAVTILSLLKKQGIPVTKESLICGLKKTNWPGRMQLVKIGGKNVLMDGAHNPDGAKMLVRYLTDNLEENSCTLVFSALGKKDVSGILVPVSKVPAIKEAIFTCIDGEDNSEWFLDLWKDSGKEAMVIKKPLDAVMEAAGRDTKEVIVCGSLYLLGELLKDMKEQGYV